MRESSLNKNPLPEPHDDNTEILACYPVELGGHRRRVRSKRTGCLPQSDADAIREASKGYTQTASDTAWTRWAQYFTEDAAFLPPHTTIRTGRAAIEAWGRSFPPIRDLRIEPREIIGRGDLAYAVGAYSLTVVLPGKPAAADTGKYIEIWQKQGDGSWKLIRDIFNSDIPIPPPSPAPTQRKD